MTEGARALFLDAQPSIEDKAELERNCRKNTGAHTLGCFLVVKECRSTGVPPECSTRTRIHLLRMDQAETHDLIYVSAAHEVLHAAYEGIPDEERRRIDRQLEAAVPKLDKCRVDNNLGAYADRGPAEKLSELHSVLATEFSVLPPGLQAHFSQYLADRQLVVAAHDRALGNREQAICDLEARLDQLEVRMDPLRRQLRQLRSAGRLEASNALVDPLNSLANEHNRIADEHNRLVNEYNQILVSLGAPAGALTPRDPASSGTG